LTRAPACLEAVSHGMRNSLFTYFTPRSKEAPSSGGSGSLRAATSSPADTVKQAPDEVAKPLPTRRGLVLASDDEDDDIFIADEEEEQKVLCLVIPSRLLTCNAQTKHADCERKKGREASAC
jgi:hypothetical protein